MQHLKELLKEEIAEAGARLAKARIAEEKALAEAAAALREVALDEAKHAALIAQLIPDEELTDTKYGLLAAIDADSGASEREKDFAQEAREAGMEEAVRLFEQLSNDELEHVKRLRKAMEALRPRFGVVGGRVEWRSITRAPCEC